MLVYQIPFSDLMPDDLKMCHPGRAKKRKMHRNRFQFAQKLIFLEYLRIARWIFSIEIYIFFFFFKDHAEIK